jgi:hypothetical protein
MNTNDDLAVLFAPAFAAQRARNATRRAAVRATTGADGFRDLAEFDRHPGFKGGQTVRLKGKPGDWLILTVVGNIGEIVVLPADQYGAARQQIREQSYRARDYKHLPGAQVVKTKLVVSIKMSSRS